MSQQYINSGIKHPFPSQQNSKKVSVDSGYKTVFFRQADTLHSKEDAAEYVSRLQSRLLLNLI